MTLQNVPSRLRPCLVNFCPLHREDALPFINEVLSAVQLIVAKRKPHKNGDCMANVP